MGFVVVSKSAYLLISLLIAGCTAVDEEPVTQQLPPLLSAAESGNLTALEAALLDAPPLDSRDSCQWTALMKAALNGHLETAQRLLALGATVDLTDKGGYSALMLAASNNHAALVELLLQAGADVNRVESSSGWNALIWAAKQGHLESVKILLKYGADTRHPDHQGKKAEDWAREGRQQAVLELLERIPLQDSASK